MIIVIPTHNRQDYFKRLAQYYGNWDVDVLLMDSSESQFLGTLPSNFKYKHCRGCQFAEKVILALQLTSENQIALCADDDILVREGLNECQIQLQKMNVGICKGSIGKFVKSEYGISYFHPKFPEVSTKYQIGNVKRRFLSEYSQILWSLYSRECMEFTFNMLIKLKPSNDNYIEILIAILAQYKFGIQVISDIYLIREISTELSWGHNAVPLGIEKSQNSITERKRLEEELASFISDATLKADFSVYFKQNSGQLFKSLRFYLYRILCQIPKLNWHKSREIKGYDSIIWPHNF